LVLKGSSFPFQRRSPNWAFNILVSHRFPPLLLIHAAVTFRIDAAMVKSALLHLRDGGHLSRSGSRSNSFRAPNMTMVAHFAGRRHSRPCRCYNLLVLGGDLFPFAGLNAGLFSEMASRRTVGKLLASLIGSTSISALYTTFL